MKEFLIQNLLSHVNLINGKYKKVAELTGENYNVFKILGLTHNEVRTHSAFLGDLLNTKGYHGLGDVFLKDFLKKLNLKDFDTTESTVIVEKHIGLISEDYDEGGRIDIVIVGRDGKAKILIENKINAGDQRNQLLRYYNYEPEAEIVYLTLTGNEVPNDVNNIKDKVKIVSYQINIVAWLEETVKHAVHYPLLRETIIQYTYLIKHLTNRTLNQTMEKEIVDIIAKDGDSFQAAMQISASLNIAKINVIKLFGEKLVSRIGQYSKVINIKGELGSKDSSIEFSLIEHDTVILWAGFCSDFSNFTLQIIDKKSKGKLDRKEPGDFADIEYFETHLGKNINHWGPRERNVNRSWPGEWVCRYKKFDNFLSKQENWGAILDNKDSFFLDEMANDIVLVLEVLREKYGIVER